MSDGICYHPIMKKLIPLASLFAVLAGAPGGCSQDRQQPRPQQSAPQNASRAFNREVLKSGTGARPKAHDRVRVHYRGTLLNGKEFDSSYKRGQPATFPLNGVIECWTKGVQMMQVGEKARLTCPPEMAYGKRGSPPSIPPDATLLFEVELLGIE